MPNRKSRKSSKSRSRAVRKPELRRSLTPAERAQREAEREARKAQIHRQEARARGQMPPMRIRPIGTRGLVASAGFAVVALATVVAGALFAQRWDSFGYADSLWLWIGVGTLCALAPFARVARTARELYIWVAAGEIIALILMLLERFILAPTCGSDSCTAFGAVGAWGLFGSIIALVILSVAGVAAIYFLAIPAMHRRPPGRVSLRSCWLGQSWLWLLATVPLALILMGADRWARPSQSWAADASTRVVSQCFPILGPKPNLDVRPAPQTPAPFWTTYFVRNANETRPPAPGDHYKGSALKRPDASPYEAVVSYDQSSGSLQFVSCRLVAPNAGKADQYDIAPPTDGKDSPDRPPDILAPAGQPIPSPLPSATSSAGGINATTLGAATS